MAPGTKTLVKSLGVADKGMATGNLVGVQLVLAPHLWPQKIVTQEAISDLR